MPAMLLDKPSPTVETFPRRYAISPRRMLLDVLTSLEPVFYKAQVQHEFNPSDFPEVPPINQDMAQGIRDHFRQILASCSPKTTLHIQCNSVPQGIWVRISPSRNPFMERPSTPTWNLFLECDGHVASPWSAR